MEISELLAFAVKTRHPTLHLSAGLPPMIPRAATCAVSTCRRWNTSDVHDMVYDIMNDGSARLRRKTMECDFSFEIPGLARFRVNAFNQNRGAGAVSGPFHPKVLTLEDLNAPRFHRNCPEPRAASCW